MNHRPTPIYIYTLYMQVYISLWVGDFWQSISAQEHILNRSHKCFGFFFLNLIACKVLPFIYENRKKVRKLCLVVEN